MKDFFAYLALALAFVGIGTGIFMLNAASDEHDEYTEGNCIVKVHENRHIFAEDTITMKRYCEK